MKKQRFFIIGGMGYLGSYFAKKVLKLGATIQLFDSLLYEQDVAKMLSEITEKGKYKKNCDLIIGDIRNTNLLETTLKKFNPTYVLHFAELSSVYACNHNPSYTTEINFEASKAVINICEKLKLKVLYNSSSSVYGTQKVSKLMTEKDELPPPTDYYCVNKLKIEKFIKKKVAKNPNFKIIVFRPATVFGLSPRFRIELLPNHFTYLAISRKLIKISDLNAYRAAIDLDDLIEGYIKVVEKGFWNDTIYNIGHLNLSKREFALGVKENVKCKIGDAPNIGDLRNLQIDCSKFNKEFDFHPRLAYSTSIKKIALWLKKNLDSIENNNFSGMLNMPLDRWHKICS